MKKLFSIVVATTLVMSIVACGSSNVTTTSTEAPTVESNEPEVKSSSLKIGAVLIGDENESYTYAHIEGLRNAFTNLELDEKEIMVYKYKIPDAGAYDACIDLVEQGCNLIITNSYGHQDGCQQAASENPDIEFVAVTGDTARKSGLDNFHNAFTKIYQARYLGGVAAGMKIQELIDSNKLTAVNYDSDGNVKIGYVGAFNYAEVVSGYTAFYLGVKSIVPNVVMDVRYTNSWGDMMAENEAATALVNAGAVIVSEHADTTGAPTAVEELNKSGKPCYSVGYNVDMKNVAPNAALLSPLNNWTNYYTYLIGSVKDGKKFDTNWSEGFETDSVRYTNLTSNCAEGTAEKLNEIKQQMIDGKLHVFDTNTFTINGEKVESAFATDTDGDWVNDADEAVFDGYYHESYFQSAPSFSLRIDGIHELN